MNLQNDVLQQNSYQFYKRSHMPPKANNRRSAAKEEKKDEKAVVATKQPETDAPKTRTRGRQLDTSPVKDAEPEKKVKKNESQSKDNIKSSKTEPKKTDSNLSASKVNTKVDPPAKKDVTPAKKYATPAKQAAKQIPEAELKKVILKGKVPVDQYFSRPSQFKVYCDGTTTYASTLNQSNMQANNNKFYILQILQNETNPSQIYFFTRWGRVGVVGQQAEIFCPNIPTAIREFHKKRQSKITGGYKLVEMNYDDDETQKKQQKIKDKDQKEDKQNQPQVQSNLDPKVQDLVRLIFDMKMMNNAMKEIGYDAKKMPLGKLAKSSILKGYEALKVLMDEVKGKRRSDVINQASGEFYSYIPHDFGFAKMQQFVLDTDVKVKAKLEMLQTLEDIQVFTKLLDQGKISSDMNELDSNYLKLSTNITPLDKSSETYKLLLEYVQNTHASTHTAYKLQVEQIFELSKDLQNSRYRKDINNKQLLWHGSRLTNYVGILSQGLRIAPPQAPVTGYMFGKGVYFADMVTKSANYCFTSRENNTGIMLLCEVALGGQNQKFYADYYANLLPEGKMSTKGCGKTAPGGGKDLDGVFVPCGKGVSTNLASTSLLYNQFIVYDIAQIKTRFLFKMKFNYSNNRW